MKISSQDTFSFKGHSAGKIKALYMQNAYLPAQIPIYNELRNIGKKHNFDVYIHNQDKLYCETMAKSKDEKCDYQLWAQDNKTILTKDGKTVVISGIYMPEEEFQAAECFARVKGVEHEKAELFLSGGNFYIGNKPDGNRYLIIGFSDVHFSALHHYLKSKTDDLSLDVLSQFLEKLELKNNKGEVIATEKEFDEDFTKWGKIAMQKIQETFDVERENVTILPQGEYHNDLVIRPLNYPYVLVNDEKMSEENIKKLEQKFKFDLRAKLFAKDLRRKIKEQNKEYGSSDRLCKNLEKNGFIPIRIGGGYGLHTINFINSIVHQNGNDLIYITNSGESGNKYFEYLQTLFENDLKEKCPQVTKTYFVKGLVTTEHSNIVLEYLKRYKGGIHCLCAEEMKD